MKVLVKLAISSALIACATPVFAGGNVTAEQLAICRAAATEYADSQASKTGEPATWQDIYVTAYSDCVDTYAVGGYYPGEGVCTSYPCGRY